MMIKAKTFIVGTLCAIFAMGSAAPPARAWLLLTDGESVTGFPPGFIGDGILCIITLPFCLLDKKDGGKKTATASDLAANGYTPEQIQVILSDQNKIAAQMKVNGLALMISPNETKKTLSAELRSVDPGVSQSYLDFAAQTAGVK